MSYDSDFERFYEVRFKSGKIIHVSHYTTQDVKDYCADEYGNEVIDTILQEVYYNDEE